VEPSLITTKLYIPPAPPELVRRPRLLEKIKAAVGYKLTLVSAPAGFGKTTLLSEWIHDSRPPASIAWLSLEEADDDPRRFWEYFIAALRTLMPDIGETSLSLLSASQPIPIESVLTPLINDLADTSDSFLVLDDYHFISSKPVHEGIAFLLEHLPPRLHLVIATRKDPPLPVAHFRGKGTILEIGADDLRFTFEEAFTLLKELQAPALTVENVKALNDKAEGWVVGLKMAMLSMRGEKDIPGFISGFTGSQRYIMDYLIEEVLQRQSPEVRDFLLKTSVLERLNGPLCDAVTGRHDGQEMLIGLEKANLFLVPLDELRQWYRYEHLFAGLLRHRLELEQSKDKVSELQIKASEWYGDNGYGDEAIEYALAAQDWPEALNLIEQRALEKERLREIVNLHKWIDAIPRPLLLNRPYLYRQYIAGLVSFGQFDAAETALKDLEPAAANDENLRGEIALTRMHINRWRGDITAAIGYAEEALSHLAENNLDQRADVNLALGIMKGQTAEYFEEAIERLTEAIEIGRRTGNRFVAGIALVYLSLWSMLKGQLHKAYEMARQAIEFAGQSPAAAAPYSHLATLLYEWNDLEGAIANLNKGIELNRYFGSAEMDEMFYNRLALTLWAKGDTAGAFEAIAKVDRIMEKAPDITTTRTATITTHVLFALRQGDTETAREWLGRLPEKIDYNFMVQSGNIRIRAQIASGEKSAAAEFLRVLSEDKVANKFTGGRIHTLILQALAADKPEDGVDYLAEAMTLARPEGYIRAFVDNGMALAPVLRLAISRGTEPEYARKLLDIILAEERQRRIRKGETPPATGLLSEREMEVLRLLAEGLSNQQIAERLVISLSTAKNHVHSIIDKLEVRSRTQAVTAARGLGLI
jgi:LuxR family maltose regulon positive regulatory protein